MKMKTRNQLSNIISERKLETHHRQRKTNKQTDKLTKKNNQTNKQYKQQNRNRTRRAAFALPLNK